MKGHHFFVLWCLVLSVALGTAMAAQDDRLTPAFEREIERAARLLAGQEGLRTDQQRELERVGRLIARREGVDPEVQRQMERAARAMAEAVQERAVQEPRAAGDRTELDHRERLVEEILEQIQRAPERLTLQGGRTSGPAAAGMGVPVPDLVGGPVVTGAPFSAEAMTTVVQTLGDGTNIEQKSTSKFYRDRAGRVRREQTIIGLDGLTPSAQGQPQTVITIDPDPGDPWTYVLDPVARTARRVSAASGRFLAARVEGVVTSSVETVFDASGQRREVPVRRLVAVPNADTPVEVQGLTMPRRGIPPDLRPTEEQLGVRQFDGVRATGQRTTVIIPTDRIGNDRPIQITDERWESPELRLVVYSRFSDPRTGVVEYRLTNINRAEPRADLFTVPADYTVVGAEAGQRVGGPAAATPVGPTPGVRVGGPGQRSGGGGR